MDAGEAAIRAIATSARRALVAQRARRRPNATRSGRGAKARPARPDASRRTTTRKTSACRAANFRKRCARSKPHAARNGITVGNVFHAGDGNLHPLLMYDQRDRTASRRGHRNRQRDSTTAAIDLGGTISGEHGIGYEKRDAMTRVYSTGRSRHDGTRARRLRSGACAQSGEDLSERRALPRGHAAVTATQGASLPRTPKRLPNSSRNCDRTGEKVVIAGGDNLAGMGFPPERADVTLEHCRLTGVVANERADLVVAVRAGTPLQDVTSLLAGQGQFVPFDAPRPQYATLGGTLAAGWLGPRRHLYGRLRDYLIGSTIVLADGTIARAGGMVVKNVAGYDMSRLYVGSFGTLGVLTQANLKTIPSPPHARLFLAPLPERTRERACNQLCDLADPTVGGFLDRRLSPRNRWRRWRRRPHLRTARGQRRPFRARDARAPFGARARGRSGDARRRCRRARGVRARRRCVRRYSGRTLGDVSPLSVSGRSASSRARRARTRRRFELRTETIVDVMNGDVVLRVSDLRRARLRREDRSFDDALHELEPRAQVVASEHPHRAISAGVGRPTAGDRADARAQGALRSESHAQSGLFRRRNLVRVLLLGASGFVGKHLAAVLRERGDDVVSASLRDPAEAADAASTCDAIVNLAGEPLAQRWNANVKQRIEDEPRRDSAPLSRCTRRAST